MSFRITGLDPQPFDHLWTSSDEALAAQGVVRMAAPVVVPDRISLRNARPGDRVLLLNHVYQPADGPYHASHAIFVLEGAREKYDDVDRIPEVFEGRTLSLRGFDAAGMMIDADLVAGSEAGGSVERLLADPSISYIQAHFAKYGCYAARIERA
jgi:hypothetical protein